MTARTQMRILFGPPGGASFTNGGETLGPPPRPARGRGDRRVPRRRTPRCAPTRPLPPPDRPAREAARRPRGRPARPDGRDRGGRVDQNLPKGGGDAHDQVEDDEPDSAEDVLDVVAEDPEEPHVPDQVEPAAVHEHGDRKSTRLNSSHS